MSPDDLQAALNQEFRASAWGERGKAIVLAPELETWVWSDSPLRIKHVKALLRVMTSVMNDDAKLFKRFMDGPDFQRWMTDVVFALAYEPASAP